MNVRESYSRALEQGTLAECRILLGGRGRGEVGSCVVWCAFDGFRTTYLGISALHPFTSLIRRSNPTHSIHYKTDLHANHHAMHACMRDVPVVSAQFEIRSLSLFFCPFLYLFRSCKSDRLLPSRCCTCAIDQQLVLSTEHKRTEIYEKASPGFARVEPESSVSGRSRSAVFRRVTLLAEVCHDPRNVHSF